ncbi:MAG: KEOPS complex kinase/ATPase Bud32 [archaeon]|jgi:Kae1-associated kinase Bud32|nr:KEOPS complex kinase/ATPase Bud32 [archaeon]HIK01211.1 Kae1-associated serine/threonine protein kinase [Candidatus Undinarchaeales archaeon ERR594346 U_76725]|tara:strand:- start:33513 stop:34118 length:606 start_codon:yes stop_codon:yes gene_type:complete
MNKLLKVGAEAKLSLEEGIVIKERISKGYRLPEIDASLRNKRTRREASLLDKARRAQLKVPAVKNLDKDTNTISMEFIDGDMFHKVMGSSLSKKLGSELAKLHDAGLIHGDLTTSNILVKSKDIYLIDFGLGEVSDSIEKKAVDIRVLKESIKASHPKDSDKYIESIISGYSSSENSDAVMERLEQVEGRGRYKKKVKKVK